MYLKFVQKLHGEQSVKILNKNKANVVIFLFFGSNVVQHGCHLSFFKMLVFFWPWIFALISKQQIE